jgi:hypothetical protein
MNGVPWIQEIAAGIRFARRLPRFLRRPVGPVEARAALERRIARRADDFLTLTRNAIYANPISPYRELLASAGCAYGDVEELVRRGTVEDALVTLRRQGVYLTVDEFKGRRPARRGAVTINVTPSGLQNPGVGAPVLARTGGSRSPGTPIAVDLDFIRDRAVDNLLALQAWGDRDWAHATWGVPGGAIVRILDMAAAGSPPVRWFSQMDPGDRTLHPRYRWSARITRWMSLVAGVPLPSPRHVQIDRPEPIVDWMAETLRAGRIPHLHTFASSAVRVCGAAFQAGVGLTGARLTLSGEPVTAARLDVVRRTGAVPRPCYSTMESGPIGYGCLAPVAADDVHVLHDMNAIVQGGVIGVRGEPPSDALFVSSLRPTASPVLFNVALGDQAILERRACGCPLEALGWTTHVRAVRSYEKLTTGGMTFLDVDVIRVLEEVLPARFGGVPTDYQLVEEETPEGGARLTLRVHPGVGTVADDAVLETLLDELSQGAGAQRVMARIWRDASLLRVERHAPSATPSGKILHLHVASRRGSA